jgi:hypothetical protein
METVPNCLALGTRAENDGLHSKRGLGQDNRRQLHPGAPEKAQRENQGRGKKGRANRLQAVDRLRPPDLMSAFFKLLSEELKPKEDQESLQFRRTAAAREQRIQVLVSLMEARRHTLRGQGPSGPVVLRWSTRSALARSRAWLRRASLYLCDEVHLGDEVRARNRLAELSRADPFCHRDGC